VLVLKLVHRERVGPIANPDSQGAWGQVLLIPPSLGPVEVSPNIFVEVIPVEVIALFD